MDQISSQRKNWTPARHLSIGPAPTRRKSSARYWRFLVILASGIAAAVAFWSFRQNAEPGSTSDSRARDVADGAPAINLNLPDPNLIRPLTPEEAVRANEERPFDAPPDNPAQPFRLRADAISRLRAIDCLTQAVYYEAASEGVDGGRAVAQVVLNRMRHPAWPNSVCGVVYQGSERSTGCQFTFTCDGSRLRSPSAFLWARSRQIAVEALAGRVFGPVGHATHYHADYVLPYWADSLHKMVQIGRHIFYRLRGSLGTAPAFRQRYAGREAAPPTPIAQDLVEPVLLPEEQPELDVLVGEDRTEGLLPSPAVPTSSDSPLSADLSRGTLLLDGDTPIQTPESSARPRREAGSTSCPDATGSKRMEAVGSLDLRAGSKSSDC